MVISRGEFTIAPLDDGIPGDRVFKRYSANADGSNMTETPQPDTKYSGDLIVPGELYDTKGRNYLRNDKWGSHAPYNSVPVVSNGGTLITIKRNASSGQFAISQTYTIPYGNDKIYTLSGIAKINDVPVKNSQWTSKTASTYQGEVLSFNLDDNTGSFVITQKWTSSSVWVLHSGGTMIGVGGDIITIENFMMNEGSIKKEQWQPAPEDLINDPAQYKWTLIKGEDGKPGDPGKDGQNAITGYLTNESLILPANPSGVVSSFSGANGYFRIMDGNSQALSGITFSLVSATGITTTINSSGYFAVTAINGDVGSATFKAVYKGLTIEKIIMVVKNKQGVTGSPGTPGEDGPPGPQGPATGIAEQSTVPTGPYVGMLWKNTGASGYINGVTYRWNGSKWDIFLMSVENLSVTNLAAIASTLGAVTNPFTGVSSEGGILDGETTISDAFVKIKGTERTSEQQFGMELGPLNLYSYLSNSIGVVQSFFDLSSKGLNMYTNGIGSGSISAEQLIAVPFTNVPLSSGFVTKENNTPQYRVTRLLDGAYQCEVVGQVGLSSGNMGTTTRYNAGTLPVNARPLRNEFFYAPTDRMGGRLAVTTAGVLQLSLAEANEYVGLSARYICKGPLS